MKQINKRVLQMRPPDVLARLPRDLEKHFKNFKGNTVVTGFRLLLKFV